ncbi:unnamed protein product [Spirodela intermedia]|uniref:Uncharacterized protein n=1 Tax=Spirodela intermedia TaxID=51605 RepID=A0A7I8JMN7_SPIIN|nr:unnamed protein product [Spirodela intermedia]CAA6671071.1 unnamed protein product [Spirodela intermedia]
MKELWTSLAALVGVFAFFQSLLHAVFPLSCDGVNTNELYNAVQLYLSSSASVSGSRLSLSRPLNSSAFTFGLSNNDRLVDTFNGATATWEHVEKRGFTLRVRKKDKPLILHSYLDHIMERANDIRRRNQDRLLYTNSRGGALDARGHPWESVPFKHPSTFETLAMNPERKEEIMADLRDFADGQTFYQKTGRAWKRGMIAAMANYLGYDIYDLELTEVHTNSELRKLLMKTTSKSIIVIEDIDCSIQLTNRNGAAGKKSSGLSSFSDPSSELCPMVGPEETTKSITLSGLLNFTDGLWSCCGSERIFVFTTNHIEKLDPALLRSGRMDMHVFMSFCSFPALKILMKNYLGFEEALAGGEEKRLLGELQVVMGTAQMTPADVSEVLIKNRTKERSKAVAELLEVLRSRVEGRKAARNLSTMESNPNGELEEEQEKRALESPKQADEAVGEEAEDPNAEKNKCDENSAED